MKTAQSDVYWKRHGLEGQEPSTTHHPKSSSHLVNMRASSHNDQLWDENFQNMGSIMEGDIAWPNKMYALNVES